MSPHSAFEAYEALRTRRAEVEAAVDDLIDLLDAIDAATADIEPDEDGEDGGDDELTLGAPERHPSSPIRDLGRYVDTSSLIRQTGWAAGNNNPARDDGESEPGYDLPEGDDERCASGDIDEPSLGAPENHALHPDQEQWCQGGFSCDRELVNEDGGDECWRGYDGDARAMAKDAARRALGQLEAMRRRTTGRGPDNVVFLEPGLMRWPGRAPATRAPTR